MLFIVIKSFYNIQNRISFHLIHANFTFTHSSIILFFCHIFLAYKTKDNLFKFFIYYIGFICIFKCVHFILYSISLLCSKYIWIFSIFINCLASTCSQHIGHCKPSSANLKSIIKFIIRNLHFFCICKYNKLTQQSLFLSQESCR